MLATRTHFFQKLIHKLNQKLKEKESGEQKDGGSSSAFDEKELSYVDSSFSSTGASGEHLETSAARFDLLALIVLCCQATSAVVASSSCCSRSKRQPHHQ